MILCDFNQVVIANYAMHTYSSKQNRFPSDEDLDQEDLLRHMILNSIRSYRSKFNKKYGELVICCDSKDCWRKDIFPYYKMNRTKNKADSPIDWKAVYQTIDLMLAELKSSFPYNIIKIERAEADDIIGTICHTLGVRLMSGHAEPILILSSDKDFRQLQQYVNIAQYDPVRGKFITETNPLGYLVEHVLKGDVGDGVPNFLSDGDTFIVEGKRQKPLRTSRIESYKKNMYGEDHYSLEKTLSGKEAINFARNKMMVDLSLIPTNISEECIRQLKENVTVDRSKIFNYFIKHRLKNLTESMGDF